MKMSVMTSVVFLMVCLFSLVPTRTYAEGESTKTPTTVTVKEMCGGCVKKITGKLESMKGIASIECDTQTNKVVVTAAQGYKISPRGLWSVMASIGKTPVKLVGPDGTFHEKPE